MEGRHNSDCYRLGVLNALIYILSVAWQGKKSAPGYHSGTAVSVSQEPTSSYVCLP